jgi:hypothetical protein
MNGNNLLLDTNILIYLLTGESSLVDILFENNCYISFITELELLSFYNINHENEKIQPLLDDLTIIDINNTIKSNVIEVRKKNKLKLPDSIIAATSKYLNIPLLTADLAFEKLDDVDVIIFNLRN